MTDHEPGPVLDRLVAEAVGWPSGSDDAAASATRESSGDRWSPSTNVADAMAALEATGWPFSVHWHPVRRERVVVALSDEFGEGADTFPLAACRAILAWKEERDG